MPRLPIEVLQEGISEDPFASFTVYAGGGAGWVRATHYFRYSHWPQMMLLAARRALDGEERLRASHFPISHATATTVCSRSWAGRSWWRSGTSSSRVLLSQIDARAAAETWDDVRVEHLWLEHDRSTVPGAVGGLVQRGASLLRGARCSEPSLR